MNYTFTTSNETIVTADGTVVPFSAVIDAVLKSTMYYRNNKGGWMSEMDYEDYCQDALAKAFRYLSDYTPSKSALSTWAGNIAHSCFVDAYEARKRRVKTFTPLYSTNEDGDESISYEVEEAAGFSPDPFCLMQSKEEVGFIRAMVSSLKDVPRMAIEGRIEGFKPGEIAVLTGRKPSAIYLAGTRATASLRSSFGADYLAEYGISA